jgi:hypothetical protein
MLALAISGCALANSPNRVEPADNGTDLRGLCPSTVVIQTNWWPQAEQGAIYHLLGRPLNVHTSKMRVSGPLVAAGRNTGVRLEIRAGGPANEFQQVSKLLYLDRSITFGTVGTDEQILNAVTQPTLAVFAPIDINPQALMWDPQAFPQFNTIADIGETDTKVLYHPGGTYMEFLVGTGVLRSTQTMAEYDGRPTRFLEAHGRIVQEGSISNEPYAYQQLQEWGGSLTYELLQDAGYPIYADALVVRAGDKQSLAPCLARLVPILQRATDDYAADPGETNLLLSELVRQMGGFPYTAEQAAWAVHKMRSEGILGNGRHTPDTAGDFDPKRVQRSIDVVAPVLAGKNKPLRPGLAPRDLLTNEFIAPGIGIGPAPKRR